MNTQVALTLISVVVGTPTDRYETHNALPPRPARLVASIDVGETLPSTPSSRSASTDLDMLLSRHVDAFFGFYVQGHKVGALRDFQSKGKTAAFIEMLHFTGPQKYTVYRYQERMEYSTSDGKLLAVECAKSDPQTHVVGRLQGNEMVLHVATASGEQTLRLPSTTILADYAPQRIGMHGVVGQTERFHALDCEAIKVRACSATVLAKESHDTARGNVQAAKVSVQCEGDAAEHLLWVDSHGVEVGFQAGQLEGRLEQPPATPSMPQSEDDQR